MQKLTIIKMLGIESRPPRRGRVSFFTTFANRTSLTDIRLYDMFMKYREFETILRSSPALTSLLISNLKIDEFSSMSYGSVHYRGTVVMKPEAVAWEDTKSRYHGLQPQKLSTSRSNHEGDGHRWGLDPARSLDTVRLPLCEALELRLIFLDWHTFGINDTWIANMLETISHTQFPVRKLLLVFDFRFFRGHMVSNLPTPDELWVGLDNALCAHHFDLEEIGVHIIFSVEDPNNELEIDNPYEERIVEEEEAEESDGSESEVEESDVASGEDESDMESDEESDPEDSTYIPNQSEYTDAEDEDDVELEKKEEEDDNAKGQDHKDTPGHILQHWLLGFALPKTNARYHFQQDQTNVSASENGVKSWIRLSERTNENELIFDIDEVLRRT
ncbi:uncharacterized protein EV420DRAFT_1522208 [Desarmillaria tabescens]|uniref:Uncharacterized protein n=1 Tax=Armillaria tabescens TaxID=1929756 RepID=A0AA39TYC9_ARMTA|nr:uncharacterized protein EV420DRAFT_1522208 [Desarmillaria tabescens]KAK0463005.1 hypothetical protein EV420DRAFT_1522208 [Desarmillaria tabescens]